MIRTHLVLDVFANKCATEKYLPALKCLLAAQAINPDHPRCHEQSGRLKHALDHLPEPLPKQSQEVVQAEFLSKIGSKSLKEGNEEYLKAHRENAPHVHAVVRLRQALAPEDAAAKSQSAKDIQATLDLPFITVRDTVEGSQLLDEIAAGNDSKQAYLEAARKRWPGVNVFSS